LVAGAQTKDRIELYYGIAEGNYLVGNLSGAVSGIQQILRIDADYVPALTLQARVLMDKGDTEAALAASNKAILLEPTVLEHQLLKALLLEKMGNSEAADRLIQSVIAKAPAGSDDFRAANQLRGLLQMAGGNWDAAADSFNQIYLADPATAAVSLKLSSEAYLEKARLALEKAENNEAIAAIDQAIAVFADKTGQEALQERTQLQLMRARLLAQLGQYEPAIADLQTLTAQQPDNLEATVTLASIYASAERWTALDELIPSLSRIPELADIALYFQGRSAYSRGRAGSARAKFEEAIDLKRESQLTSSLHFYRGLCLKALKRDEEANTEIIKALNQGFRPETTQEGIAASQTLIAAKQAERAIPILEALTLNQVAPTAQTWALLGRAHQVENTVALAISAYNESLKIDPNDPQTRAARGSLLRNIGDLEGAVIDYQTALELTPNDPSYAYALGLTFFQQGKIDQAEKHLGDAATKLSTNASVQLLHSLLAYTVDDPVSASESLRNYFTLSSEQPNEAALYLEYSIQAHDDLSLAILGLNQRLSSHERPDFSKNFIRYNVGKLDRKEVIDQAGIAESPQVAKQQICEAAFWMAQHERAVGNIQAFEELLKLILDIGHSDITEYQLARWQLEPN
jgi:tetratricopeptide (TPR) repeat protein